MSDGGFKGFGLWVLDGCFELLSMKPEFQSPKFEQPEPQKLYQILKLRNLIQC